MAGNSNRLCDQIQRWLLEDNEDDDISSESKEVGELAEQSGPLGSPYHSEMEQDGEEVEDEDEDVPLSTLASYQSRNGTKWSGDETYKSTWFAYEALAFLRDRNNPRKRRKKKKTQRFEMAGRHNWRVGREDAPEDFDELLRDTDSEDEGEAEYLLEEEPEEQEAEYDEPEYLDQEFLEPGPEAYYGVDMQISEKIDRMKQIISRSQHQIAFKNKKRMEWIKTNLTEKEHLLGDFYKLSDDILTEKELTIIGYQVLQESSGTEQSLIALASAAKAAEEVSRRVHLDMECRQDRVKKIKDGKSKDEVFRKCPATAKCVFTDELEEIKKIAPGYRGKPEKFDPSKVGKKSTPQQQQRRGPASPAVTPPTALDKAAKPTPQKNSPLWAESIFGVDVAVRELAVNQEVQPTFARLPEIVEEVYSSIGGDDQSLIKQMTKGMLMYYSTSLLWARLLDNKAKRGNTNLSFQEQEYCKAIMQQDYNVSHNQSICF
ncbi:hypothetical protein PYW07_006211 [Mythimna separata]|uniref:Uncharacterized protein n=1 Tax=Mythimna separata TaxID=271217 RepID=A0AAD7YUA5_MYTSE|nr:hypothetical protein PYW07_006211 [Mythimna separata]